MSADFIHFHTPTIDPGSPVPGRAAPDDPQPADMVLATYNARYTHTALGLRRLIANLGPNPPRTAWHEFYMRVPVEFAAEQIRAHQPRLVALGVYIWNAKRITELIRSLRASDPDLIIVLGGPEISAAPESFPVYELVDAVIVGEAESIFGSWCRRLLHGVRPPHKVIRASVPDLSTLTLPYSLYSDKDLRTRHIYVETTRGCPFHCDFCVSGCEDGIREFPLDDTLNALCGLAERGVQTLRFVDRTFNARPGRGARILDTLRPWADHGLRLHLEFTPQAVYREDLQQALCDWPPGALHIEVGIQSFNETVLRRVNRPGVGQEEAALRFLLETGRAEVHADLIVGLPGEDWDSIAAGFDRLVKIGPQEIQVGILKNLPGTALKQHITEWNLSFDSEPPYALRSSALLSPDDLARLTRFAAFWDRLANHKQFPRTLQFLLRNHVSAFASFMHVSDWLYAGLGRTHSIDLYDLCTALYAYLTYELQYDREEIQPALVADFCADGKRPSRALPKCLR